MLGVIFAPVSLVENLPQSNHSLHMGIEFLLALAMDSLVASIYVISNIRSVIGILLLSHIIGGTLYFERRDPIPYNFPIYENIHICRC